MPNLCKTRAYTNTEHHLGHIAQPQPLLAQLTRSWTWVLLIMWLLILTILIGTKIMTSSRILSLEMVQVLKLLTQVQPTFLPLPISFPYPMFYFSVPWKRSIFFLSILKIKSCFHWIFSISFCCERHGHVGTTNSRTQQPWHVAKCWEFYHSDSTCFSWCSCFNTWLT